MLAEDYIFILDTKHYSGYINVDKDIDSPEEPVDPDPELPPLSYEKVLQFDFDQHEFHNNYIINSLNNARYETTSRWVEISPDVWGVPSKLDIPNPYSTIINYKFEVTFYAESEVPSDTSGSGFPRMISLDGTSNNALGLNRDGCAREIATYKNLEGVTTDGHWNIYQPCLTWQAGVENTIIYEKNNSNLKVSLNGVEIAEFNDVNPTLSAFSEDGVLVSDIGGYTNPNIYLKTFIMYADSSENIAIEEPRDFAYTQYDFSDFTPVIELDFKNPSNQIDKVFNSVDGTYLDMDSTEWVTTPSDGDLVKPRVNIVNTYPDMQNYIVEVVFNKDSTKPTNSSGSGFPRLVAVDGSKTRSIGMLDCNGYLFKYIKDTGSGSTANSNVNGNCDFWVEGAENKFTYIKNENMISVFINETIIAEFDNAHVTHIDNTLNSNSVFISDIGGYVSDLLYVKEFRVLKK
jgi:hypothetical protein